MFSKYLHIQKHVKANFRQKQVPLVLVEHRGHAVNHVDGQKGHRGQKGQHANGNAQVHGAVIGVKDADAIKSAGVCQAAKDDDGEQLQWGLKEGKREEKGYKYGMEVNVVIVIVEKPVLKKEDDEDQRDIGTREELAHQGRHCSADNRHE